MGSTGLVKYLTESRIITTLGAALLLEGAFYLIHSFWKKYYSSEKEKYRLLFFPDSKPTCKASYKERYGCTNSSCRYEHDGTAFKELMQILYSARKTVDLCIFCITSPEMADAVIHLHNHGVIVRVISDDGQVDSVGSQIGRFRAEGMYRSKSF